MRILQVCTSFFPGGIQKHVLQLGESLEQAGHRVFMAGASGTLQDEMAQFKFLDVDLSGVSTDSFYDDRTESIFERLFSVIKCALQLRRFIKENHVELIHAHESAPAVVAKLAAFFTGVPVVLTYHGSEPERVKMFGLIGRLTSKLVITPSHRCAEELRQQSGLSSAKLRVIELGMNPPPVIDAGEVEAVRNKLLSEEKNGKLVVIVARLVYQKGIDVLIEVVKQVSMVRCDIRFVLLGDGPLREQVKQWVTDAGVESFLHLEGHSDRPYLYMAAADVFLLTSRWEALPVAIAEAFQMGLPVVATDTGGVRELVSPKVGYVLPVGDIMGLADSVLDICGDESQCRSMSEEAYATSRQERFSIPHVHSRFECLYREVIG